MIRTICAYCGSSPGRRNGYVAAAKSFGQELLRRDYGLVYGGGRVGMMGVVADEVLSGGGQVTGVIPRALFEQEVLHTELTELIEVADMHARKAAMAARGDAFVAMPGGLGTLEEVFEALTWTQIGIHAKPVGLLNVDDYWRDLLAFLDHTVAEGFVAQANRDYLVVETDPARLLDALAEREVE